tara:strand:- start:5004 stop:7727 length:2724 start_codon:yes stop_codon:yes gene_type:complete
MSIKTIDNNVTTNTDGVAKKINRGAEKMVFDILQSTQYSTPIPSTVRELVTNACDSQREKEIAIEILSGQKLASHYYIERHGEAYADSNFDPSYYNLNCLDKSNNEIEIKYQRNEGIGFCDVFSVKDYGVGIGSKRLEGILELGYSTKRNTAENFGAFGLGAKVALATGVDFYNITTVHNGKKFQLSCYPYTTKFNVPSFNPFITFSDGTKVHYEETDELNYTEISFGVKKHNRNRFEEGVEEQLMYLSNVRFSVISEDGYESPQNFLTDVIHNSESLLVADSYYHSKPHIVIVKEPGAETGINYGYVDFRELEMQQLWGAVGLKCPIRQVVKDQYGKERVLQEGVDVTPSREKVIWNEHTKKFVQDLILRAAEEATELVQDQLKSTDFLEWIGTCRDVLSQSSSGDNSALRQISKIIETDNMKPKFSDTTVAFAGPKGLFKGFNVSKIRETIKGGKISIETIALEGWGEVDFSRVYFRQEGAPRNNLRDHFIIDDIDKSFVLITPQNLDNLTLKSASNDQDLLLLAKLQSNQDTLTPLLKASELFKEYSLVEPDDKWLEEFKTREIEVSKLEATTGLTRAERRMIEKRIVAYSLRNNGSYRNDNQKPTLTWDKVEPKLKTVMTSDRVTYYCTREDELWMKLAAEIMRNQSPTLDKVYKDIHYYGYGDSYGSDTDPIYYYDQIPVIAGSKEFKEDLSFITTPQLLRVAENKIKYVEKNPNCYPIQDFFLQITDEGKYTMSKEVKNWMNAKIAGSTPDWVWKLDEIDPRFKDLAVFLDAAHKKGDRFYIESSELKDVFSEFLEMTNKLRDFQDYCKSVQNDDNSEALIASKSAELFILADIPGADIFEEVVAEYAAIRDEIVDEVDVFLSDLNFYKKDNSDFTRELTVYLKAKGKLAIELPEITPNNK